MVVRKRRVQIMPFAIDTVVHRADEFGFSPLANAGVGIGRDVGRVDRAERRFQRSPAGVENAARAGMADRAVAERGKLLAAGDGCRGIDRGVRPRNRRD